MSYKKKYYNALDNIEKLKEFNSIMSQWIGIKQEGLHLSDFFLKNNWKEVAIYGYGELGHCLDGELRDSGVTVKYIIDRNADRIYSEVPCKKPEDDLGEVDAVVITPVHSAESIKNDLKRKLSCSIISLDSIMNEI